MRAKLATARFYADHVLAGSCWPIARRSCNGAASVFALDETMF